MKKTELRKLANEIPVTGFMDYRSWLAAIYQAAKKREPNYSYSKFSDDLNIGSSNAHLVINGKRPLTAKTGGYIMTALRMTGRAKRYFEALIAYERAKTTGARDAAFAEMMELKTKLLDTKLDKQQLLFFAHWYNAAILELLRLPHAVDHPEWIAATLSPKISVPKAKQALKLLVELGYLAEVDGQLRPTDTTISTGDEVKGLALSSFHKQMIDLAKQAIDEKPAKEREISALTLSVPAHMKSQIKKEIVALRKRLIAMSQSTDELEEIIQVNFQMFSLGNTGDQG